MRKLLPYLHDPDGHEVPFCTSQYRTGQVPDAVSTLHHPRERAEHADLVILAGLDRDAARRRARGLR